MKYEFGFCFRYGSIWPVLNDLSLVTSTLFFARRNSPSCRTLVVLQESMQIAHALTNIHFPTPII